MAARLGTRIFGALLTGAAVVALAGCQSGLRNPFEPDPLASSAASAAEAVPNLAPDDRGVITYATYQVAVARDGDTMATIAGRLGITTAELAAKNGLPEDYRPRAGEVLALPDGVARSGATDFAGGEVSTQPLGWSPERAAAAIEGTSGGGAAPVAAATATTAATAGPSDNPFDNGQTEPLIDPVRHRVEAGETAYSIARLYGVSVTALASWNGLGPDLAVRENQELLIPIVSGANQISSGLDTEPGEGTPVTPPPIASEPLPENITPGANPASPNLGQYRTPAGGKLQAPVKGPIIKQYSLAPGPDRSEGIGISAPAGTPVGAAGDGEVALVSESLGGLGTIVLIRHSDDLMTVYGRVENVTVARGQRVTAGQPIGAVAAGDTPELHFEVRRGTESVDPAPYLGG